MAFFRREDGISTLFFAANCPLRIRVNMSAMGSVILMRTDTCFVLTRKKELDQALHRAWPLHVVYFGTGRTCDNNRAVDRSPDNDCAGATGWRRVVAVAIPARPQIVLAGLLPDP